MLLCVRFLRTCPRGFLFHRVRGRRTPEVGTGAQCATLSPLQRARRLVACSFTACRVDFVFPRRWLTHSCRKPIAGGCAYALEAARQGKTAVVTVLSDQTGHWIRQASRGSRRGGWVTVDGSASFVTSQTRQSRHLPFVRGCTAIFLANDDTACQWSETGVHDPLHLIARGESTKLSSTE